MRLIYMAPLKRSLILFTKSLKMEKQLIKIVAKSLDENPKMVTDIIRFYEKFIATTIKSGNLENVRVPLFGIFRVNMKKMYYHSQIRPEPKTIVAKPPKTT